MEHLTTKQRKALENMDRLFYRLDEARDRVRTCEDFLRRYKYAKCPDIHKMRALEEDLTNAREWRNDIIRSIRSHKGGLCHNRKEWQALEKWHEERRRHTH